MNHLKRASGFTLIELMIVIAILGIITAIAIPAYTGYITSARMSEAKSNIAALKLAQEEYFLENNGYFDGTSASLLNTNSDGLWTVAGGDGGINFSYNVSTTSTGYVVTATGTSGKVLGKTETYTK